MMNIDETIRVMEFFLHKQCDLGRMKFTPYDDDNLIWHVVNDVFEEWKWYKSQDLIKIEDVIDEIEYECNSEQSEMLHRETIIDVINQIPIVEYRGDDSE